MVSIFLANLPYGHGFTIPLPRTSQPNLASSPSPIHPVMSLNSVPSRPHVFFTHCRQWTSATSGGRGGDTPATATVIHRWPDPLHAPVRYYEGKLHSNIWSLTEIGYDLCLTSFSACKIIYRIRCRHATFRTWLPLKGILFGYICVWMSVGAMNDPSGTVEINYL
jgi:hypothetical protein